MCDTTLDFVFPSQDSSPPVHFGDYVLLSIPILFVIPTFAIYYLARPPPILCVNGKYQRLFKLLLGFVNVLVIASSTFLGVQTINILQCNDIISSKVVFDASRVAVILSGTLIALLHIAAWGRVIGTHTLGVVCVDLICMIGIYTSDAIIRNECRECSTPLFPLQILVGSCSMILLLQWSPLPNAPQPQRIETRCKASKPRLLIIPTNGNDITRVARYSP